VEGLESMGDKSCWTSASVVATDGVAKGPTLLETHEQDRRLDSRRLNCFSFVEIELSVTICIYMNSIESIGMYLMSIMYERYSTSNQVAKESSCSYSYWIQAREPMWGLAGRCKGKLIPSRTSRNYNC
jgi:hypothetical protein